MEEEPGVTKESDMNLWLSKNNLKKKNREVKVLRYPHSLLCVSWSSKETMILFDSCDEKSYYKSCRCMADSCQCMAKTTTIL